MFWLFFVFCSYQDQDAYNAIPPPAEDPGTPAIQQMVISTSIIPRKVILAEHRAAIDATHNDVSQPAKLKTPKRPLHTKEAGYTLKVLMNE